MVLEISRFSLSFAPRNVLTEWISISFILPKALYLIACGLVWLAHMGLTTVERTGISNRASAVALDPGAWLLRRGEGGEVGSLLFVVFILLEFLLIAFSLLPASSVPPWVVSLLQCASVAVAVLRSAATSLCGGPRCSRRHGCPRLDGVVRSGAGEGMSPPVAWWVFMR